jgi:hypothetical protein
MSPLQRLATLGSAAFALALAACGSAPKEPAPYEPPKTGERSEGLQLGQLDLNPIQIQKLKLCGLHVLDRGQATFAFDGGDAQAFQLDGIYDDALQNPRPVVVSTPAAWSDATNASTAEGADPRGNLRGSAFFIAHPQLGQGVLHDYWRLGFVSPALGNVWQGKGQYTFDVLDEITFINPPLYAQLVLQVRKCDGTTAYYRQVDGNRQPVFCQLAQNHAWTHCAATIDLTGVDAVLAAEVRVFVPAGGYPYEGAVYLDNLHAQ